MKSDSPSVKHRLPQLLLLPTFLVGGVVSPVVHRIQHAMDSGGPVSRIEAFPSVQENVGIPLVASAASTTQYHEPFCVLCKFSHDKRIPDRVIQTQVWQESIFAEGPCDFHSVALLFSKGRSPPAA